LKSEFPSCCFRLNYLEGYFFGDVGALLVFHPVNPDPATRRSFPQKQTVISASGKMFKSILEREKNRFCQK
jgi:hypothetical protein